MHGMQNLLHERAPLFPLQGVGLVSLPERADVLDDYLLHLFGLQSSCHIY